MTEKSWFGLKRSEIDWFPKIDYGKCISCMACVNKCEHRVYAEKYGKPKVIAPKNCVVGCTGCQSVCTKHAISHPPKSYLQRLAKRNDFKIGCQCGGKSK